MNWLKGFVLILMIPLAGCLTQNYGDSRHAVGPLPVASGELIRGSLTSVEIVELRTVLVYGSADATAVALQEELTSIFQEPGLFDGEGGRNLTLEISSIESEEVILNIGVLVGNHSATSEGSYVLKCADGTVLHTASVDTQAEATLDDAASQPGRRAAAHQKALFSNAYGYRQILIALAARINDESC